MLVLVLVFIPNQTDNTINNLSGIRLTFLSEMGLGYADLWFLEV